MKSITSSSSSTFSPTHPRKWCPSWSDLAQLCPPDCPLSLSFRLRPTLPPNGQRRSPTLINWVWNRRTKNILSDPILFFRACLTINIRNQIPRKPIDHVFIWHTTGQNITQDNPKRESFWTKKSETRTHDSLLHKFHLFIKTFLRHQRYFKW